MFLSLASAFTMVTSAQDVTPTRFNENIGNWFVSGVPEVCIAETSYVGGTELLVVAFPNRSDLIFSFSNSAWTSLTNGGSLSIPFDFYNHSRRFDAWIISATAQNTAEGNPGFNFPIEIDWDDGGSFPRAFARADSVNLSYQNVPIARLELKDSAGALALLLRCRSEMRGDPSFDPFRR